MTRLAHAAGAAREAPLSLAAEAHNKAALIASDCGLPVLARDLCWRQFRIYLRAAPLDAATAQLALQPAVNIARLTMRDSSGLAAYHQLDTLYQAVSNQETTVFDGQPVNFRDFTRSREDHHEVTQWLWKVLLGDGTRALTLAGHWDQAAAHAGKHHGIGTRLLDGRQAAIIARCLAGQPEPALGTLRESTLTTPWEQAVASCLAVICLTAASQPAKAAITAMTDHYLGTEPAPRQAVFLTRLGLTVLDLADQDGHPRACEARTRLLSEAMEARDGHAASDVLASQRCAARLTDAEREALSETVRSSGLGAGTMPPDLLADLLSAAGISEATAEKHAQVPRSATPS